MPQLYCIFGKKLGNIVWSSRFSKRLKSYWKDTVSQKVFSNEINADWCDCLPGSLMLHSLKTFFQGADGEDSNPAPTLPDVYSCKQINTPMYDSILPVLSHNTGTTSESTHFFLHKRCQSLFYTIQLWNCFSTRNILIIKHRKHFSCVNILQTSWADATEVNDRSPTDLIEIRERLLRNMSRKIVLKRPMENNCLSCSQEFISMTSPDARQKAQLTAPPDVCFTRDSGNSGSLNFINTAVTAHWLLFCILNCWDGEWYQ